MSDPQYWQKSSFSGGGEGANCVEIAARDDGAVLLRESDEPEAIVMTSRVSLGDLVKRIKSGQTDPFSA